MIPHILFLAVMLSLPTAPATTSAADRADQTVQKPDQSALVRARTEKLIDAFKRVKEVKKSESSSASDQAANAKSFAELDGFFARDHFVSVAIEPRRAKFSDAQLTGFRSLFWSVVQLVAYPGSGAFFREAKVEIAQPTQKGEVWTIDLKTYVPSEDLETVVGLQWKEDAGQLRIIDVLFDGDSLVRDYQNQFARIVDKDGAQALIDLLHKKKAELSASEAKAP
ncbi:MAG: ABC transporter substrate-binding protein [Myxococcales bacterium]|jgi:ABC-type transporter MlaC component|nr:ABC transporter substrate-binding protein [Myxococcales bacterium]